MILELTKKFSPATRISAYGLRLNRRVLGSTPRRGTNFKETMRLEKYLTEKMRTSKQYVVDYMENMMDNDETDEYKTWKEFFQSAKNGAYDWSEDLWKPGMNHAEETKVNKVRDGILKVKDTGFSQEKKIFKG